MEKLAVLPNEKACPILENPADTNRIGRFIR
jgi:hypothetical protein